MDRELWLKALNELNTPLNQDACTRAELQEMFGLKETQMKKMIKKLVDAKKVRVVTKRTFDRNGYPRLTPAYYLEEK